MRFGATGRRQEGERAGRRGGCPRADRSGRAGTRLPASRLGPPSCLALSSSSRTSSLPSPSRRPPLFSLHPSVRRRSSPGGRRAGRTPPGPRPPPRRRSKCGQPSPPRRPSHHLPRSHRSLPLSLLASVRPMVGAKREGAGARGPTGRPRGRTGRPRRRPATPGKAGHMRESKVEPGHDTLRGGPRAIHGTGGEGG